jgi:HSP20 family protein
MHVRRLSLRLSTTFPVDLCTRVTAAIHQSFECVSTENTRRSVMAEMKSNRSESSRETGQAVSRRDRDRNALQRRDAASWLASPFDLMDRMAEEMDRSFDRMFRDFGLPRRSLLTRGPFRAADREGLWSPRVEAFQKGDRYIVRAELPGLKKDDVQVEVTDDALTIQGERREEHEEEREGYYHSEREYGQFHRTVPLPEGVIAESAQASFTNGVLEISMQAPPAEATRGRRLEIKDAAASSDKK